MTFFNDYPCNWAEKYEKIAIFRVHRSIFEVRKCPICQKLIEDQHGEAIKMDNSKFVVAFELL